MKKKTYTWPSEKELKRVLPILEKAEGSRGFDPNFSVVDKIKYELCKNFIAFKHEHNLTQKDLAVKLGIDPALMSKILRKRFDDFTIDRLVRYLEILDIKVALKVA